MNTQNNVTSGNTDEMEKDIFADSTEELENNGESVIEDANNFTLPSGDALNDEDLYLLTAKRILELYMY